MTTLLTDPSPRTTEAPDDSTHNLDFTQLTPPHILIYDKTITHKIKDKQVPYTMKPTPTRTITSTVFEVKCGRSDQHQLTTLLTHITSLHINKFCNGVFVPTPTHSQQPEIFFNLLATQNNFLATTRAISVSGIAPAFWLQQPQEDDPSTPNYGNCILYLDGPMNDDDLHLFLWVEMTKGLSTKGCYIFIYPAAHEDQAFEFINTTLLEWYTNATNYHQFHDDYNAIGYNLPTITMKCTPPPQHAFFAELATGTIMHHSTAANTTDIPQTIRTQPPPLGR